MGPKVTPMKLEALRNSVGTLPNSTILRAYLIGKAVKEIGVAQNKLFKDAVLVTVHRKWLEFVPHNLMEIGITMFDKRKINDEMNKDAGAHAENFLNHVWFMHLRLQGQAHLPQGDGDPDKFHFGGTVFVTPDEALAMLHNIWHQPIDEAQPELGCRPIIYLSFGDNDGLSKLRRDSFDFVPSQINTTIAVMDAQVIAAQVSITRDQHAPIDYLLKQFGITLHDRENTGNAAAYTTIVAMLSALRADLYHDPSSNPKGRPGQRGKSSSKPAQDVIQAMMERPTPNPPYGTQTYCHRCGSYEHFFESCEETDFVCTKCSGSDRLWRQDNAATHKEGLCIFRF